MPTDRAQESLSERLAAEKIAQQRDRLRAVVDEIRDDVLYHWRAGRMDAETAMDEISNIIETLPRFVW